MRMYAMIEGDGFFGDRATVCETTLERKKALGWSNDPRWQVIGGPDHEFEVGQKIHRKDIGAIYPRIR